MKTKIYYIITSLLTVQLSMSQVLFSENFDSYPTGNFSNDFTGTVPGPGGWYTKSSKGITNFELITVNNKGKVLALLDPSIYWPNGCSVFRTDLNTYWQQRTAGNNVLKLTFDLRTHKSDDFSSIFMGSIYNNKEVLVDFNYAHISNTKTRRFYINLPLRGKTVTGGGDVTGINRSVTLPDDSWVTVEIYIDYNNNKVYLSVPSLNGFAVVSDTRFPLTLVNTDNNDDNPVKLELTASVGYNQLLKESIKFDNINISAQNTVPTLGINEILSKQFNTFPNPATNMVNITNNENMVVKEVAVYDVTGKLINTQSFNEQTDLQLNVEHLASGTYLLHLHTVEGTAVKKLVKK